MTFTHRPDACLSDLLLDRWIGTELAGAERERAQSHLAGCAACKRRLDELARLASQFGDSVFVEGLAARTKRRLVGPRLIAGAFAIACVSVFAILAVRLVPLPTERSKGSLALELVVRRAGQTQAATERLLPGARLAPGDAIRFQVSTDQSGYLAIVGVDAAAAVTLYYPAAGSEAAPMQRARRQLLEGSIVLDETLGAERIIAVECPAPIALSRVSDAARRSLSQVGGDPKRLDTLALGCPEVTFLIEKIKRR